MEIEEQEVGQKEKVEKEVREEKRARILDAAVDIFSGNFFHLVKMDEIASHAGVGKGTLYLYFESKEELFRQSFQYAIDLYYFKLKGALENELTPKEKLKKIVYLQFSFLQEHLQVIYLLVGQSMVPPLFFQEEVTRARGKLLVLLEDVIRKGIERGDFRPLDPALAARSYLGGIISFLHDLLHEKVEMGDAETVSEEFALLYFEGFNQKEGKTGGPEC